MNERVISWFSCGVTSAVATKLAVLQFGELVDAVYIKIDQVHPDNARFIADCEEWIGIKVRQVQSDRYRTPIEVAQKERFINGPYGAKCTSELKRKVRIRVEREAPFASQVFGFEYSQKEVNRAVRFKEQNPSTRPVFPLVDKRITKEKALGLLEAAGIEVPAMYQLGYQNNNCLGCFKGGRGYWNKIRDDFPLVFDETAALEREIGRSCISGVFLDELLPGSGRQSPVIPACDLFCAVDFADVIAPATKEIMQGAA